MDDFGKDHTPSTSMEPNYPIQGNDVKRLSEEMDFKLKNAHNKRLTINHFMTSSASKTSVPKQKNFPEKNKTQILDVEEQHYLPRSFSFDFKDSIMAVDHHDDIKNNFLEPYDPIKNYLSPRPRYLKYNPDRRREIFSRQKNVNMIKRSASYDGFPKEELESREDSDEEIDIISPEHGHETEHETEHEREEEKEEVFDDFKEGSGWNLKVFMQYLIVIIILILTTVTITSVNSPHPSLAKEAIQGFMNLYNKTCSSVFRTVGFDFSEVGKLIKREIDVNHDDNMDSNQLEGYKTEKTQEVQNGKIDEYHDGIWSQQLFGMFQDSHTNEIEEKEEVSYELQEPVILTSEETYSDYDRGEVSEELEILEMMVEEDVGKEDANNIGVDEYILIKLARFDTLFAAFIGVCVLILATLSIIYYTKKSKTTITHQHSTNNTKYLESFENSSPLTHKTTRSGSLIDSDAVSSNEEKSSYLEFSTDSPSYGSFTVEKKIVKKKKSKKPEVILSPVRRSSRIYNQSSRSP